MTGPIHWAEQGFPPFKAERRFEEEDAEWGLDLLNQHYEDQFEMANPFLYHGFGLELMFETEEAEHESKSRYVDVEFAFGFGRLKVHENPFAPLADLPTEV